MVKLSINPNYLGEKTSEEMQAFFEEEAFIQLNEFFNIEVDRINSDFNELIFSRVFNPMRYKFKEVNLEELKRKNKNNIFSQITTILESVDFLEFVSSMSQFDLDLREIRLRKYANSDFVILNDQEKETDTIDVYFDLSNVWNEDFGGKLTYTSSEEELFYLHPTFNNLSLIFKPDGVQKYLKYVNCLAHNNAILRFELKFDFVEEEE